MFCYIKLLFSINNVIFFGKVDENFKVMINLSC